MRRGLLFLPLLLLAGCAPRAAIVASPRSASALDTSRSFAAPVTPWPETQWWRAYRDPQLDALVAEALANSPDVASAAARVRAAAAIVEQAGAARSPYLELNGQATLDKQSYNNGIPAQFIPKGWNDAGRFTLGGNFDLDLWGRNRAALAAATSDAQAAQVDAAHATLLLATSIASSYADLARLFAERAVLARAVAIREESLTLNRGRYAAGLDNLGTQQLSATRAAAARADLAAAEEAIQLTRNRIAALVGAGPDRGLAVTEPRIAALHPQGLPERLSLDLVGRRPDIVAARLRSEAASSRIRSARATFYPNINLNALIGVQSLGLDRLVDGGSTIGSVGPAISLPIFGRGRLRGELRGAEARYDEAVASYDSALLGAVREVADAAASIRALEVRQHEAAAALAAAEGAYSIARQRYEGGLSTFLDVLTAEDALLDRRRASADLAARAFSLDVALARALGGGFGPTETSTSAAARGTTHG
ncbi:MAG: nodT [Sphingomonas bacterium]|nr:efflux transporter outer membrane subunit [Sphingomonas bacterium]MDB5688322.1 nodT [Sphingomonas bacterium]